MKPSDYRTVPLCAQCHGFQHQHGERTFWNEVGEDPNLVILKTLGGYFEDRRRPVHVLETLLEHERGQQRFTEAEEAEAKPAVD